jgi:tetratricopeptide (TPR) repeat protein
MEAFEDTIVARPALKRLEALLPGGVDSAPSDVRRALFRDNLSDALDAANRRWSKRGAADRIGAITYATLLVVRDLLDEAQGVLQRAREEHPDAAELRVLEAERLLLAGDADAAGDAFDSIALEGIEAAGVASIMGDLLLDLGRDEAAVEAYERAIELGSRDIEIAIRVAQIALHDGEVRRAAESFERAARQAGDRVGLWEATADAWFRVGEDARGLDAYGEVLRLEDGDAQDWLQHGLSLARVGDAEAAEAALERSVDLDPFEVDAWVTLGQVRMQLGRAEAARAAFEHALERREDDIDALLGVVSAALVIGDLSLAEEVARRAVEALPEDPEAHHSLGIALQEMGRHDEAVESLQQAVELADALQLSDAAFRTSLALSRLAGGGVEDAVADIEDVLAEGADEEGLVVEFVEGLIRAGAFEQARTFMAKHGSESTLEELLFPVFEFVMAAYKGEDATPYAHRALEAARAHADALPVDWDFEQLERLSLRMDRDAKQRFSELVGVLEGRSAVGDELG